MTAENNRPEISHEKRFRTFRFVAGAIAFVVIVLMLVMLLYPQGLQNRSTPKTFWRKDYDTVVKYHVRDYRVPWSDVLLVAIAFAHEQKEPLYLEDTPRDSYTRNRGNIQPVIMTEAEQIALRQINDFLTNHCRPDQKTGDRIFANAEIAEEAKRLFDEIATRHPQLFYSHYLLGVLAFEQGDASAADHFARAMACSDCVVMCPILTLDTSTDEVVPVVKKRFPFGIVTKHRTEQGNDFELWYPLVETDQHGLVKLPVYRNMAAEPSFAALNADGQTMVVQTFGVRDIAEPYRFGLYEPVVLSAEQLSQLTCLPGYEEELRFGNRLLFAKLSLDDHSRLAELGIAFEDGRIRPVDSVIVMPTLRYVNVFGDLHFRGLTRTELAKQLQNQPAATEAGQTSPHDFADGDNFILRRNDGRTFLCLFFRNNTTQPREMIAVWDLGCVKFIQENDAQE